MMTLLETLNGVEGRPEWLNAWRLAQTEIVCEQKYSGNVIAVAFHNRVSACPYDDDFSADELLELAFYLKRVQTVLERLNAPVSYMVGEECSELHDSIDDAIGDAFSRLDDHEDGEIIELEIYEAVARSTSNAVNIDYVLEHAHERYYGDRDDWASDESVIVKDGARPALEAWAEAYLRPSTPAYECGERIVRHVVARDDGAGFDVVEDIVAKALAADKTPRTINIGPVRIAVNADGSWQEVKP